MHASNYSAATQRVNDALEKWLPAATQSPQQLHTAMRYAVLDQGKRMRPLLTYATGEVLGVPAVRLDAPACAVELIHAYSLVHDDLPAMDDDDLRRGKPTTHKAYGEATAILVGDALQALAFHVLATDPEMAGGNDPIDSIRVRTSTTLSYACGSLGMAGGQTLDMAAEGRKIDVSELDQVHHLKTEMLLQADVLRAADCCDNAGGEQRNALQTFAQHIGLAFQVRDDVLDIEGSTDTIGKRQGADTERGKATYPALLGMQAAKDYADSLYQDAMLALDVFGDKAAPLRDLASYVIKRDR